MVFLKLTALEQMKNVELTILIKTLVNSKYRENAVAYSQLSGIKLEPEYFEWNLAFMKCFLG